MPLTLARFFEKIVKEELNFKFITFQISNTFDVMVMILSIENDDIFHFTELLNKISFLISQ